ncbi:hypothetical protein BH23GEM6_BH23GEM6_08200 [soil metagenome]
MDSKYCLTFQGAIVIAALLAAGCGAAGEEVQASPRGEELGTAPAAEVRWDTIPDGEPVTISPSTQTEWTAGRTEVTREPDSVATLQEIRTARNEGFDRVVFVFQGGRLPSYTVEYIDRPIRECGSGNVAEVDGDGWLSVHFTPARAHTDQGQATITQRNQRHQLPVIRHVRSICDFEAHLEWVIGTGSPNRYRVLELSEPARVVVDIRH